MDLYPGPCGSLIGILEHWARQTPSAPALLAPGCPTMSLADLMRQAGAVCDYLNRLGLGRDDRIAIVLPQGMGMAACVLSVAVCATAVPLDPKLSPGETARTLASHRVTAIIVPAGTDTPIRRAAIQRGIRIIDLHDGADGPLFHLQGERGGAPQRTGFGDADHLALLLSTSGTTSAPRIVPITSRGLVARGRNAAEAFALAPADRCLNPMPLFHGHGVYDGVMAPLVSGGSSICWGPFDVERFFEILVDLEPSWYTAAFTFHHAVAAAAPDHRSAIDKCRLTFARSGSGALDPGVLARVEAAFGVPVVTTYALTESGVVSATSKRRELRRPGSVGLPPRGTLAILGETGELVPAGARGEVAVRGPHVSEGYLDNPEATAAARAGEWLRTGDQGYLDDDGYLYLTGRIKEIINRGGEKVAPHEIDAVLVRHPDIAAALTFPVPHPTLGEDIAAVVVRRTGSSVDETALKSFARSDLAPFKVPRRFVFVDALPTGASGKPSRIGMAARLGLDVATPAPGRAASDAASATPLQAKLAAIWGDILEREPVGLDDDFFTLGGDSLQAVQLFAAVEANLARVLPQSVLLGASTVREMARLIEQAPSSACLVPIQPNGTLPPLFCIHDGTGQVLNYRLLAEALGRDQPVYALQARGLDRSIDPLSRIEDMAALYLEEIRALWPTGPYFLCGFSFGGRVAYVMAQMLRREGEAVGFLGLIDSYSFAGRRRASTSSWLSRQARLVRATPARDIPAYVAQRIKNAAGMAGLKVGLALFRLAQEWAPNGRLPRLMRRPRLACLAANRRYQATSYEGRAVLFKAKPYAWMHADAHEAWHGLVTGGLEVVPIPGEHFTLMGKPHVQVVAGKLAEQLAAARNRGG